MTSLVLASSSPRRRALIGLTGWPFVIRSATVDESPRAGESARSLTARLARAKAAAVDGSDGQVVVAADTAVELGGRILGKPSAEDEARAMLRRLRGGEHRVVTAIAVRTPGGDVFEDSCESKVRMRPYSDEEIERYLRSGEPFDKAGGYAIQDGRFQPVDMGRFRDCYANVVGLPLCHVVRTLRRAGCPTSADVPAACAEHTGYDCPVSGRILEGAA